MDFKIVNAEAFSVISQQIQLTGYKSKNITISSTFWVKFNKDLKKEFKPQSANWVKYAFIERNAENLCYRCAVPMKSTVPSGFEIKEIKAHKYLVFEHIGDMSEIYNTYFTIYKDIIPESGYKLEQEDFLHFEKYDYRFKWNSVNSVIEIWVPVTEN